MRRKKKEAALALANGSVQEKVILFPDECLIIIQKD